MPNGMVSLENLYDLQNHFKGPFKTKTHSSILSHEQINIVTKQDPKFLNLGTWCTPQEQQDFIHLFKQYRDIFTSTYDDIKNYYMIII